MAYHVICTSIYAHILGTLVTITGSSKARGHKLVEKHQHLLTETTATSDCCSSKVPEQLLKVCPHGSLPGLHCYLGLPQCVSLDDKLIWSPHWQRSQTEDPRQ